MSKFLVFLAFFFYCCVANASYMAKCIVAGQVSSPVKKGTFPANNEKLQYFSFQLKLESAKGLEPESDKWCIQVFKDRKDSKGNITVRINNPSKDTVIPELGGHGVYLWSYFESEVILEGFSPYVPPSKATNGASDNGA